MFTLLFNESLHGAPDCGGITPVNYISGESVTHLDAGVPLLLRRPDSAFTLANFMRANIYSAFATLAMGLEILRKENVAVIPCSATAVSSKRRAWPSGIWLRRRVRL